jgi:hypothetical protein
MLNDYAQYAYNQVGFGLKCHIFGGFLGSFSEEISEVRASFGIFALDILSNPQ